jgi:hypothetical protein
LDEIRNSQNLFLTAEQETKPGFTVTHRYQTAVAVLSK